MDGDFGSSWELPVALLAVALVVVFFQVVSVLLFEFIGGRLGSQDEPPALKNLDIMSEIFAMMKHRRFR